MHNIHVVSHLVIVNFFFNLITRIRTLVVQLLIHENYMGNMNKKPKINTSKLTISYFQAGQFRKQFIINGDNDIHTREMFIYVI